MINDFSVLNNELGDFSLHRVCFGLVAAGA
jgi:hypothetical protein